MTWRVRLAGSAHRDLRRLPDRVAHAAAEFVSGPLEEAPTVVGKPLDDELEGLWSARLGAYRIVYELDRRKRQVRVLRIDHRADVYRPRLRRWTAA